MTVNRDHFVTGQAGRPNRQPSWGFGLVVCGLEGKKIANERAQQRASLLRAVL